MTFPCFKSSNDLHCKEVILPHYLTYRALYGLILAYISCLTTLCSSHSSYIDFLSVPCTHQSCFHPRGFPSMVPISCSALCPDIDMFSISDLSLYLNSKEEVFPDSAPSHRLFDFSWITCHW